MPDGVPTTSSPATLVVRASSLSMLADCPRRWAARHLGQEVADAGFPLRATPTTVGSTVGTAVHAAAADALTAVMHGADLPTAREAADRAAAEFDDQIGKAGEVVWDANTRNRDVAMQQIPRMVTAWLHGPAPTLRPVAVEERIEAPLDDDGTVVDVLLSGQADVCEDELIHDLKTGAAHRSHLPQVGAYALLRRAQGAEVSRLTVDFIKRGSIRQPQPMAEVHTMPVGVAEAAAWAALREIRRLTAAWRANAWRDPTVWLANPQSILCGDRYCPAWGTRWCREHIGAK